MFAPLFGVGAGDRGGFGGSVVLSAFKDLYASPNSAEIASVFIVFYVEFVTDIEEGFHPCFVVVVEDHGGHGFVLIDHGANPAAKAGVATTGGAGIDDEGAFVIGGCALVEGEKFAVVVSPWVWVLVEVNPDFVV